MTLRASRDASGAGRDSASLSVSRLLTSCLLLSGGGVVVVVVEVNRLSYYPWPYDHVAVVSRGYCNDLPLSERCFFFFFF